MSSEDASLARILGEQNWIEELKGGTPERVIDELLEVAATLHGLGPEAVEATRRAILAREREATTGIGNGIAIPHMKECPYVDTVCAIFGRSREGVEYGSTDGEPVHLFFLIITPVGGASFHVQLMKKIVQLSRDGKTMRYLVRAENFNNLPAILQELDESTG